MQCEKQNETSECQLAYKREAFCYRRLSVRMVQLVVIKCVEQSSSAILL